MTQRLSTFAPKLETLPAAQRALLVAGIGLPMALAAARIIYGERFNPQLTLKALSFFGDGDLPSLPLGVQERIIVAVKGTDLDRLPMLPGYDGPIGS